MSLCFTWVLSISCFVGVSKSSIIEDKSRLRWNSILFPFRSALIEFKFKVVPALKFSNKKNGFRIFISKYLSVSFKVPEGRRVLTWVISEAKIEDLLKVGVLVTLSSSKSDSKTVPSFDVYFPFIH